MISPAGNLRQYMAQVRDPRGRKGKRHPLPANLTAVVCAVLCGANGYKPIAQWLHAQSVDVWHFLGFTRRPLSYGALRNVLMVVDPQAFEDAASGWLRGFCVDSELSPVSIDGKSICGTQTLDQRATMLVAAFDHKTATALRQLAVPVGTNEQKTALNLFKQLVLTGRVVTMDALHCQQETCQNIVESGGDYVIPVKENQPTLLEAISLEFAAEKAAFSPYTLRERQADRQTCVTFDKGHGRREMRTLDSTTTLNQFLQQQLGWSSVRQVFRITRCRTTRNRETGIVSTSTETSDGITSLSRDQADAQRLLELNRGHCGIENRLSYVRDETF